MRGLKAGLGKSLLSCLHRRFDGGFIAERDPGNDYARGRIDHVLRGAGFEPLATDPETRSLHAELALQSSQFSKRKPGTRTKSTAFLVRSMASCVRGMQASFRSIVPMRIPWRRRW